MGLTDAPASTQPARRRALATIFPRAHAHLERLPVDFPVDRLYREEHRIGARRDVICLAPHGGGIEPWTRFLAQHVQERATCDYWSAWAEFRSLLALGVHMDLVDRICKMLHVTSHRIWRHPALYRRLRALLRNRSHPYALALAIHGKADDSERCYAIEVGGTSPRRHALAGQLSDHGFRVHEATNGRAGAHPTNIVNLVGAESVQIEIPRSYRRNPVSGHAIAQGLADLLNER